MKKWTKEEEQELVRLTENAWDWNFPGYDWVRAHLEIDYPNGRTVNAIRQKYYSILNCR